MGNYRFFSPVDIKFFSEKETWNYLDMIYESEKNILLLISNNAIKRYKIEQWFEKLKNKKNCIHINEIPTNPSIYNLINCLLMLKNEKIDLIICIGGGSCIDLAKGISSLHNLLKFKDFCYDDLSKIIETKEYILNNKFIDIIAVPTTSGTGSEVTKWATIWDFQNKRKLSIESEKLFPKVALIVPELTTSMSERLTLSTGLDALSHAMESFWAKSRSPLSQSLALDAIKHIKDGLPNVLNEPNNIKYRGEMSLGSLISGLAFSTTKTTACHSISYSLTINCGIEHGFAVALTLNKIAKINLKVVKEIKLLYDIFGGEDGFLEWLSKVTNLVQPLKLSKFGVKKKQIKEISQGAFTQGRIDNNPVSLTFDFVEEMLNDIF